MGQDPESDNDIDRKGETEINILVLATLVEVLAQVVIVSAHLVYACDQRGEMLAINPTERRPSGSRITFILRNAV
jgi:hypothetical protein